MDRVSDRALRVVVAAARAGSLSRAAGDLGMTQAAVSQAVDDLATRAAGLRQLGASYYALEEWGVDSALYRFHCKMAMREDANICRHFEAVDASASVAVDRVLNQVLAWRASLH